MKKQILLIVSIVLFTGILIAQSPQAFKYQAVARDNIGNLISNQLVAFRISILQGGPSGTLVYQESHTPTTNDYGLSNLEIGQGNVLSGTFNTIVWSTGPMFMKVELDPAGGTSYQDMGSTELLSVPYALYSNTSGSSGGSWNTSGNNIYNSNSGNVGVGLSSPVSKMHIKGSQNISQLVIDADIGQTNTQPIIRLRGDAGSDLMWIHTDASVNMFIGVNAGKSNVAGSGGINNVFIGKDAGSSNTTGNNNSAIGFGSLSLNTTGYGNTASGSKALFSNTSGSGNNANGNQSLYSNTTGQANTASGYQSLMNNITGSYNSAYGIGSLYSNTSGYSNTSVGLESLFSNTTGYENTATGFQTLHENTTGVYNTATGFKALFSNTTANYNTAIGYESLYSNTTGYKNTACGFQSLYSNTTGFENTAFGLNTLYANTTGQYNSAFGSRNLRDNTTGSYNTALGFNSLVYNTSGGSNTAIGTGALLNNTTGNENTGCGISSLYSNTTGIYNTAYGAGSMTYNTTGNYNTSTGYLSMWSNVSGNYNTAGGYQVMRYNTSGTENTATGSYALYSNTSGNYNTAIGTFSLYSNVAGTRATAIGFEAMRYANDAATSFSNTNVAVGYQALMGSVTPSNNTGIDNTAIGYLALPSNTSGSDNVAMSRSALGNNTSGSGNTALGRRAGYAGVPITTGSYNTLIGYSAAVDDAARTNCIVIAGNGNYLPGGDNRVRIGNASMSSIGGQVGWTTISDERVKTDFRDEVIGLDFIMKLKPLTYSYSVAASYREQNLMDTIDWKGKYDIEKMRFSGFRAQEVEQAAIKAGYDFSGVDKPQDEDGLYGLRYAEFVVPLVKAVQELDAKNETQKVQIHEQQQVIEELLKRIEKLENK
jgi:trimeric autotransporter adhesin